MDRVAEIARMAGTGALLQDPRGLFALGAVVVLVLYGLSVGRTKALVSLLAIYVAYVLAVLFPFSGWLDAKVPDGARAGLPLTLFLTLYILVFLALSRSLSRSRLGLGEISLGQVLIISAVQVGLLTSIGSSLLPAAMTEQLFGPLRPYLAEPRALWGWAAASLLVLPLLRARRRKE